MGKKRKRPQKPNTGPTPSSQTSITAAPSRFESSKGSVARDNHTHPVISLYYRQVLSLRQYLLSQLPVTSKLRRRRITALRAAPDRTNVQPLADLLDTTLVGVLKESSPTIDSERQKDYRAFTQSQSRSVIVSTDTGPTSPQSEVVDFVIGQLFKKFAKPDHVLAHGFRRPAVGNNDLESNIPGVGIQFPNQNVCTLKESPWTEVLSFLGENGDEIMLRLLLDCGIFAPIDAKRGSYYQLSGEPLSSLNQMHDSYAKPNEPTAGADLKNKRDDGGIRSPNAIIFLRRSMLYGKHASWSNGKLVVGLGKTHVLNRFQNLESAAQTIHVMMYIFPRQFGLRNVFKPTGDPHEQFNSFGLLLREDEIFKDDTTPKTPKRLRGQIAVLVHRIRIRHARCSFYELLRHYCPTEPNGPWKIKAKQSKVSQNKTTEPDSSVGLVTQLPLRSPDTKPVVTPKTGDVVSENKVSKPKISLTDYATPASSVSAFSRAVLLRLIPLELFGEGADGVLNRKVVMKHVDAFIKMRRFETLSLHELCKGLKVASIPWLASPTQDDQTQEPKAKMALSDFKKRTELLHEFIYYLFDSILIPLIRSTFYVTESQTHRNRLFYFRHDVWQSLIRQPLSDLKKNMFEEIETEKAQTLLERRALGAGTLRLLPKSAGIRPILNLRRRQLKETTWGGRKKTYLGASINSSLGPIYNMLSYERKRAPEKFGSSLQYVGDIHIRLRDFKKRLIDQLPGAKPSNLPQLFFVKLDIQGCFDTIPQKQLLSLIEDLVSEGTYHVTKHVEMKSAVDGKGKPMRRFVGRAEPMMNRQPLPKMVIGEGQGAKSKTVYIDTINQKLHGADDLLDLLDEHVRKNLVQMGKTYLRQQSGIPQGSVISNLLCNFFYAQLEHEKLDFLQSPDSVLLRLVDDFLLVTTDVQKAMKFLQVMIPGQPSYGVMVNPAKSMSNFTASVNGIHIPRLEGTSLFPYCGILIDTHSLDINRDHTRLLEGGDSAAETISNTLTIETSNHPGHMFRRKVLGPFRLQIHPMYLDDAHNSRSVVLANLHNSFMTAAMKMYRYMKSLRRHHPSTSTITSTIQDLIQQTFDTIHTRRTSSTAPLSCFLQLRHLQYLAAAAFRFVLNRKQTRYVAVLRWLDTLSKESRSKSNAEALQLQQVVKKGTALFEEWKF